MAIWIILKEAVVFLIASFSCFSVAEQDILENFKPNKANPPELNDFLNDVLKYKDDFKWIRETAENLKENKPVYSDFDEQFANPEVQKRQKIQGTYQKGLDVYQHQNADEFSLTNGNEIDSNRPVNDAYPFFASEIDYEYDEPKRHVRDSWTNVKKRKYNRNHRKRRGLDLNDYNTAYDQDLPNIGVFPRSRSGVLKVPGSKYILQKINHKRNSNKNSNNVQSKLLSPNLIEGRRMKGNKRDSKNRRQNSIKLNIIDDDNVIEGIRRDNLKHSILLTLRNKEADNDMINDYGRNSDTRLVKMNDGVSKDSPKFIQLNEDTKTCTDDSYEQKNSNNKQIMIDSSNPYRVLEGHTEIISIPNNVPTSSEVSPVLHSSNNGGKYIEKILIPKRIIYADVYQKNKRTDERPIKNIPAQYEDMSQVLNLQPKADDDFFKQYKLQDVQKNPTSNPNNLNRLEDQSDPTSAVEQRLLSTKYGLDGSTTSEPIIGMILLPNNMTFQVQDSANMIHGLNHNFDISKRHATVINKPKHVYRKDDTLGNTFLGLEQIDIDDPPSVLEQKQRGPPLSTKLQKKTVSKIKKSSSKNIFKTFNEEDYDVDQLIDELSNFYHDQNSNKDNHFQSRSLMSIDDREKRNLLDIFKENDNADDDYLEDEPYVDEIQKRSEDDNEEENELGTEKPVKYRKKTVKNNFVNFDRYVKSEDEYNAQQPIKENLGVSELNLKKKKKSHSKNMKIGKNYDTEIDHLKHSYDKSATNEDNITKETIATTMETLDENQIDDQNSLSTVPDNDYKVDENEQLHSNIFDNAVNMDLTKVIDKETNNQTNFFDNEIVAFTRHPHRHKGQKKGEPKTIAEQIDNFNTIKKTYKIYHDDSLNELTDSQHSKISDDDSFAPLDLLLKNVKQDFSLTTESFRFYPDSVASFNDIIEPKSRRRRAYNDARFLRSRNKRHVNISPLYLRRKRRWDLQKPIQENLHMKNIHPDVQMAPKRDAAQKPCKSKKPIKEWFGVKGKGGFLGQDNNVNPNVGIKSLGTTDDDQNNVKLSDDCGQLQDAINGRLATHVVQGVIAKLKENEHLYRRFGYGLHPHNRHKEVQNLDAFKTNETNTDIKRTENMLHQIMNTLNKIIFDQVRRRTCQHLPPDLKYFLGTITKSLKKDQERGLRVADSYPLPSIKPRTVTEEATEEMQGDFLYENPQKFYSRDINRRIKLVKTLLEKYENMSSKCRTQAQSVQRFLKRHLDILEKLSKNKNEEEEEERGKEIMNKPQLRKIKHTNYNIIKNNYDQPNYGINPQLIKDELEKLGLGAKNTFNVDKIIAEQLHKQKYDITTLPNDLEYNTNSFPSLNKYKSFKHNNKREIIDSQRSESMKYRKLVNAAKAVRQKRDYEEKLGKLFGKTKKRSTTYENFDSIRSMNKNKLVGAKFEAPLVLSLET